MIDKKPPRFSKASSSAQSFDDDLDDVPGAVDPELDQDAKLDDEIDPETEAAAILAAQKRRANMVTYGGGAIALVVLLAFGYPRFKHYFVSEQPAVAANVATPVPPAARKNYFAGSDKTATATAIEPVDNSLGSPTAVPVNSNPLPASGTETVPEAPAAPIPSQPAPKSATVVAGSDAATPTADTTATTAAPVASSAPAVTSPLLSSTATASVPGNAAPAAPPQDMDAKLSALSDRLDKLASAHAADQAQLQALQAGMASMQKQLAEIATVKQTVSQNAPVRVSHPHVARQAGAGSSTWELRSATNDMALIGHPGQNDLKKIAPGDMVTGLGKITSIEEQDGGWVVHGTSGSIRQ